MNTMALVRPVTVADSRVLADGIRWLRLVAADGGDLPDWAPGAHLDLILPSGLVRQYSLCGSPTDRTSYEIAVLREPAGRGGSAEVHEALRVGDEVRIAGPRNRFPLEDAASYVFVAGGIGITPLLSMIREATLRGRDWRLVYGGRTRASMAFRDELEAAHPDRVTVLPQDEVGLIDLEAHVAPQPGALVYCCGPEPLLAAVEEHCARRWPPASLHVERFIAEAASAPPSGDMQTSFEVQLGLDGPVLTVSADQSILHTLLDADVDVLYSCEEGTCGSCETQVLAGEPDHRDTLLDQNSRDGGCMLICVSRCAGARLVLDVDPPAELTHRAANSA
jgi:ferredoxin-NADP reductase